MSLEKTLRVKVITNAREESVRKSIENPGFLEVRLTKAPIKGEANKELLEVLSNFLGVPKSYIDIVKGARSKYKIINVKLYEQPVRNV